MEKSLNQIIEISLEELVGSQSESLRNRIYWICEKTKGENILDVGCSQGITSLLLAREGKKVLGIDVLDEVIKYARGLLANQEESMKEFVDFRTGNFMTMDLGNRSFDCILFGEVLNHVSDPQRFIEKALGLLNKNGLIIVTVPFGLNKEFDHKKNYYLKDLLELQGTQLSLKEIKFIDKWVGVVFKKSMGNEQVVIDHHLLSKLERTFAAVEKQYVNDMSRMFNLHEEMDQIQLLNREQQNEIDELKRRLEGLDRDSNPSAKARRNDEIEKDIINEKNISIESIKKNIALEEQLLASIKNEEKLLLSYKNLLRKYNALSNSKLGKLTMYYWKKRRRVFGGK